MIRRVIGFMLSDDTTDVLMQQTRLGLAPLGGLVDHDELPVRAMGRLYHEQAGVLVTSSSWRHFLTLVKASNGERFHVHSGGQAYLASWGVDNSDVTHCFVARAPRGNMLGRWSVATNVEERLELEAPLFASVDSIDVSWAAAHPSIPWLLRMALEAERNKHIKARTIVEPREIK